MTHCFKADISISPTESSYYSPAKKMVIHCDCLGHGEDELANTNRAGKYPISFKACVQLQKCSTTVVSRQTRATMSKHRLEDTLTSAISHYCSNQTACGCSLPSCTHIHCTFCKSYFPFLFRKPSVVSLKRRAVTTCEQFPPSTSAFQVNGKKKKTFSDCKCHVSISPVSAHTPSVVV